MLRIYVEDGQTVATISGYSELVAGGNPETQFDGYRVTPEPAPFPDEGLEFLIAGAQAQGIAVADERP